MISFQCYSHSNLFPPFFLFALLYVVPLLGVFFSSGAVFEMDPMSYSNRGNGLHLATPYLYACNAGALVHAAMKWDHHETGTVDWTK